MLLHAAFVLLTIVSSRDGSARNRAPVTSFYEDNPTYQAPTSAGDGWEMGTPESVGMSSALLEKAAQNLAQVPQSLSFLVIRRGVLVFERYFHGSAKLHSNNIHSASKSILSALTGIALREAFLHSVDQKISTILSPRYTVPENKKNLTVRHLLTMSGGLAWTEDETEYEIEVRRDWVKAILALRPIKPVGETFFYNTGLTHLLSAVLTEASGLSTSALAKKYLFKPLGATFEHWGHDPQGYNSGGYNLYLTPRAMAKFGQLYLQQGVWHGQQIVPQAWVEESLQVQSTVDSTRDYGYLWWLPKFHNHAVKKMWGFGGQFVYLIPGSDTIVVMTADTKKDYPEMNGDSFLQRYFFP